MGCRFKYVSCVKASFRCVYVCVCNNLFLLYVHWCFDCICLYEGVGSFETGVIDSYGLQCSFWELNLGSLKEQPVLFTAEPSLQPLFRYILIGAP